MVDFKNFKYDQSLKDESSRNPSENASAVSDFKYMNYGPDRSNPNSPKGTKRRMKNRISENIGRKSSVAEERKDHDESL